MYRILLSLALAPALLALPPLRTVQDTLFLADGSRFNGLATVSWPSFEASDGSSVAAQTLRLQILNGFVRVQLVPTTTALTAATYSVKYNSDGRNQYSETWAVPPGVGLLRISDVRVQGPIEVVPPAPSGSIQITDVAGLQNALNIRPAAGSGFSTSRAAVIDSSGGLNAAQGSLSDCLHVDGTAGPCGNASAASLAFVDGEAPSGLLDGVNPSFSFANSPNPTSSLLLYRNGLLQRQGQDFTLAGASITFQAGALPHPGDILVASYRLGVALTGVGFVDVETPGGSLNGANTAFTLAQSPVPAGSLIVFRNGLRLRANVDYSASGSSLTFLNGQIPQSGDVLLCSYRIAQ
ncbi:MAG: hypothetical protein M3O35_03540 [Acidobacteriota bacterium]|nr:hypothetical protein [Acidobacteriota bacterium]